MVDKERPEDPLTALAIFLLQNKNLCNTPANLLYTGSGDNVLEEEEKIEKEENMEENIETKNENEKVEIEKKDENLNKKEENKKGEK